MKTGQQKIKGFTLLEILLVLAIASSLVVLMLNYTTQRSDELRRDKTVLQMQQILNAGMSFYVNNSFWPLKAATITSTLCGNNWTDISALQPNYIPTNLINNSYANPYLVGCSTTANGGGFYVYTTVSTPANAAIIAGRLPMAFTTTTASVTGAAVVPPTQPAACTTAPYTGCNVVVANVSIPGQNLNNARSVNFASVYFSGSCVPAPNCPANMTPSIMVMPAAVSGNYSASFLYPINSFTAFARGSATGSPVDANGTGGSGPPLDCNTASTLKCAANSGGTAINTPGVKYWRVCLSVTTQQGVVAPGGSAQGQAMGSIVAITRCVPNAGTEVPSGSINVWQN